MLKAIRGVFRQGKVELVEEPRGVGDNTPVVVTFLNPGKVDLQKEGIGLEQASDLRTRLAQFAQDWDEPEMDLYDNYDAAKSRI